MCNIYIYLNVLINHSCHVTYVQHDLTHLHEVHSFNPFRFEARLEST